MTKKILILGGLLNLLIFESVIFGQSLEFSRVASGLVRPVFGTAAPGDPDNLFIVDARGQTTSSTATIRILNTSTGVLNPTPFLSIPNVSTGGEQGLLGLAFHPDYQTNGRFFVNFTTGAGAGSTIVQEYTRSTSSPLTADPSTARQILSITQPFTNHNGGWLGFSPRPEDRNLYIATGDGGSGNDPNGSSQRITNDLLGKMLRINVDGDAFPSDPNRNYSIPSSNPFVNKTGDDEIWAYGLRNPWRPSFDRLTGDLYIADVGQVAREEINVQRANSVGGENYGWGPREGMIANATYNNAVPARTLLLVTPDNPLINPVFEYPRSVGFSITGGYVYRGPLSEIQGHYFFADHVSNRIMSFKWDGTSPLTANGTDFTDFIDWTGRFTTNVGTLAAISSFGEDSVGNLYAFDLSGGEVFRLSAAVIPEPSSASLMVACAIGLLGTRRRFRYS